MSRTFTIAGKKESINYVTLLQAPTETNSDAGGSLSDPCADNSQALSDPPTEDNHQDSSQCVGTGNIDVIITRAFPDFDLKTLLQTTAGGNHIINYYNTFGTLDSSKRNQLTEIIVKHIYTHAVHR